jgi:bile acid-coenzyme A ligase
VALLSISRIIALLAERDPDRPAITFAARTVTRRELDRRTNRLARAYRQLGVAQDDFVTIALPNGIEFFEATIAAWKLGATPQPVSSRLPKVELEAIVELASPRLVVGAPLGTAMPGKAIPAGYEPDAAFSDGPLPDCTSKAWKAPTSGGSTGRPKIIVSGDPGEFDLDVPGFHLLPDRAHLIPGPLYHNGPFSFGSFGLFLGNHLVIMPRFDAAQALELMALHRVDWTMMVPTMLLRIWRLDPAERRRHDLSALRVLLHLAAPCPPWLKEALIGWLGPDRVHELYGGTEGQGATWIVGDEWLAHRGSVGRPMAGSNIKILDDAGRELPTGQVGEVFLLPDRGVGTTYRYIGAEPRRRADGWETLGDMGYLDADGYLYLTDRRTDMILRGGANIYPAEVEAAIDAHPAVRSSAVIGLPDEELGNRVHAIVDATQAVTADEISAFLRERLVGYKIPESFEFVAEPLRDDAGKSRRSALRASRIGRQQNIG